MNAAMILFGLVMERACAGREQVDRRPSAYGCVVGAVPCVAIALQIGVSQDNGNGVPGFAITLVLLCNTFAVNMWPQ